MGTNTLQQKKILLFLFFLTNQTTFYAQEARFLRSFQKVPQRPLAKENPFSSSNFANHGEALARLNRYLAELKGKGWRLNPRAMYIFNNSEDRIQRLLQHKSIVKILQEPTPENIIEATLLARTAEILYNLHYGLER